MAQDVTPGNRLHGFLSAVTRCKLKTCFRLRYALCAAVITAIDVSRTAIGEGLETLPAVDGKLQAHEADVVVIGSGIGGLSCAALLAKYGLDVTVLESHTVVGGAAHVRIFHLSTAAAVCLILCEHLYFTAAQKPEQHTHS